MNHANPPRRRLLEVTIPFTLVGLLVLSGCLGTGSSSETDAGTTSPGQRWTSVYPGEYRFDKNYAQVLEVGPYKPLPYERVVLKTGEPHLGEPADIEIGIYRPNVPDDVKVPIIVDAGPYYGDSLATGTWYPERHIENFLSHGYAIAAVAVRGSGHSGGCFDYMGPKEQADMDDSITWLGSQDWTNGNIGMMGVSYDGSTTWTAAATGNPQIKTIVPIVSVPSVYELSFKHGQANMGSHIGNFHALYYAISIDTSDPQLAAERAVCPDSWAGVVTGEYMAVTNRDDPLDWWRDRHHKPDVEANYRGSILVAHGFADPMIELVTPWVGKLNASGIPTKQLYYPADHMAPDRTDASNWPDQGGDPLARYTRWDWAEILLHWFDRWLKEDTTVDVGPPVQVQDDKSRWRNEADYPPSDAVSTVLYLGQGGTLDAEPSASGDVLLLPAHTRCPWNFCDQDWQRQCLGLLERDQVDGIAADFTTPPLQDPLHIAGTPVFHARVTPDGPTGMIGGWLYDVDEDGNEKRIGWGGMNLAAADGDATGGVVVPGQPVEAAMEFIPLDAYVPANHSLRLRAWQCPAYAYTQVQPASPVTLEFGGDSETRLDLPTIERGPEAFFDPPWPEDADIRPGYP